ncbi:hypothetical protein Hypma_001746 [Hypsizygus marmoreus]|uniref:SUZ domain-containing protein n=1 Tax=Hypsizygus marmoreus TaxID=39966 RepID=A0A369J5K0_HYPMA|nr:hypothetical protein Hypma_001746 [Hypsizygus marmoreus]
MAVASSSTSPDPWDTSSPTRTAPRAPVPKTKVPVRDDWEEDDDDDEEAGEGDEQGNQRIWNDAYISSSRSRVRPALLIPIPPRNAKQSTPMPALILSPSVQHPVLSPPPGAFQPAMRILKRPSSSTSANANANPTTPSGETLKEREARYQVARERIFGEGSASGNSNASSGSLGSKERGAERKERKERTGVNVVRNPKGPGDAQERGKDGDDAIPRGFGGQRAGPPVRSPGTGEDAA